MRMRKKKNLNERLGVVSDYLYISGSEDRNFNTAINDKDYIDFDKHDLIFWSPLGGSIGYCDCLKGNAPNIQKELDIAIENGYFNHYV